MSTVFPNQHMSAMFLQFSVWRNVQAVWITFITSSLEINEPHLLEQSTGRFVHFSWWSLKKKHTHTHTDRPADRGERERVIINRLQILYSLHSYRPKKRRQVKLELELTCHQTNLYFTLRVWLLAVRTSNHLPVASYSHVLFEIFSLHLNWTPLVGTANDLKRTCR